MHTKITSGNEGIDKRTIRAATESMTLDRHAGEYDVYAESGNVYRVNVVAGTCECPSAEYQQGACKHQRRFELEAGQREIPELGRETDVEMMIAARERAVGGATKEVATDGGVVADATPQGSDVEGGCPHDHPDCEGADSDTERPVLCFDCWDEWARYDEDDEVEA